MYPLTVPNHTLQNPEAVISNTRLYKGNIASPQGMIHFSQHFLHTFLGSITDLSVGVLTCLQAPFLPL